MHAHTQTHSIGAFIAVYIHAAVVVMCKKSFGCELYVSLVKVKCLVLLVSNEASTFLKYGIRCIQ